MKTHTKRWGVLLLASILSAAMLLNGCSNSKGESSNNTANAANPADVGTAKGKVQSIKWMGGLAGYPLKDQSYAAQYLEKKFNVKIEVVKTDNDQQFNLQLSTGDIPDVFKIKDEKIIDYSKNNILAEIPVDLIKKHMPKYYEMALKFDPNAFNYGAVDGKNYGLPMFNATVSPVPIAIRGDWLTNVGSNIPTSLQELEDVFVKFRNNDPDKNGKKDTYGLSMGSDATQFWFQSIFGAFGTHPFLWQAQDSKDKIVYGFTTNETKDALKLLNKWYKMGLIDPEFITDKSRTNAKDDTAYKFSSGRIGYIDNLTYDDHQWDNDGQLSAKWVANAPEWQKFYSNPDNANITEPFTAIPTSGPQPVYVNIKPPVGPNGKSGSFTYNSLRNDHIVFGSQVGKDQDKMVKLMEILEAIVTDEETYINVEVGPEGTVWEWNKNKQRVYKPEWLKSDMYHPQGRNLGTGQFFDLFFAMNFNSAFGGPRAEQRYEKTQKKISANLPAITNALKAPLPSASKYNELTTMIQEYILKAILGEVNIDSTFDDTVNKWYKSGGQVLTDEANNWYKASKK